MLKKNTLSVLINFPFVSPKFLPKRTVSIPRRHFTILLRAKEILKRDVLELSSAFFIINYQQEAYISSLDFLINLPRPFGGTKLLLKCASIVFSLSITKN